MLDRAGNKSIWAVMVMTRRCSDSRSRLASRLATPGKAAKVEEVRGHAHVLTPGRYGGAADIEDDGVLFAERFSALRTKLETQFGKATELEEHIRINLSLVVQNG